MKSIIIILSIFLSLNSFSEKVYFINLEDGEKLKSLYLRMVVTLRVII
tara:strand:- start:694 stop:837 length:144 start_codon:yes stop_codon:yes gene_type:complete